MTRNIAALLLAIGLLFLTTVGVIAHGSGGFLTVKRSDPSTASAPATIGAAGLASCTCACGYTCEGDCIGWAPPSCSQDDGAVCVVKCCTNAPSPDPACPQDI
jgi:hypothetical protein